MKKQPLLWMTIAAALLSGCTGHREHHPQVTFTVDTVRTDTTASNPICLAEKYGSLLNERHPDLFAGAQGSISRSAFFNDSLTLTPETLHGMIQNTPCVESLVTSVGPDTFTADVSINHRDFLEDTKRVLDFPDLHILCNRHGGVNRKQ